MVRLVLVVDDDPDVLETVADSLRCLPGVQVQTAGSGREALERARTRGFDLIVTDVQMPAMSGLELLHDLKREFPDVPVVMMSGDPISRQRGVLAGADSILAKPFRQESLANLVRSLLRSPTVAR
jgi:CheY-like chemotaxis protein